ncbi:MAG: DUF29 domain-containing protein [Thiothrix sp.]
MGAALYETDFYGWANEQARLLREHRLEELDLNNLLAEVETMAGRERRELVSRLRVLLAHLLKWQYEPDRRGKSWQFTIRTQARDIRDLLGDNPSLKSHLPEALEKGYSQARELAAYETGLEEGTFPEACPYDLDQALTGGYYPE